MRTPPKLDRRPFAVVSCGVCSEYIPSEPRATCKTWETAERMARRYTRERGQPHEIHHDNIGLMAVVRRDANMRLWTDVATLEASRLI